MAAVHASLHPGSRFVELHGVGVRVGLGRLCSLHQKYGPNLLLRLNPASPLAPGDTPLLSPEEAEVVLKLEHEIDHLHRVLATSFGLFDHLVRSRQVDLLLRGRAEFESPGGAPDGRPVEAALRYGGLSAALTCPSSATDDGWRDGPDLFADVWRGGGGLAPGGCGSAPRTAYQIRATERTRPLGGLVFLELFALVREVSLRSYAGLDRAAVDDLFYQPTYQQVGQLWKRAVRDPLVRLPDRVSGVWPGGVDPQQVLPVECYAAADLALWPPLGPAGPVGAAAWRDVQPGHRFLRALEVISDLVPDRTPTANLAAESERLRDVQGVVCSALGWPTPTRVAAAWEGHLRAAVAAGSHERRMLEDDWARAAGSLFLLGERLRHSGRAALGFYAAHNRSPLWFSGAVRVTDGDPPRGELLVGKDSRVANEGLGYPVPPAFALSSFLDDTLRRVDPSALTPPPASGPSGPSRAAVELYLDRHYRRG